MTLCTIELPLLLECCVNSRQIFSNLKLKGKSTIYKFPQSLSLDFFFLHNILLWCFSFLYRGHTFSEWGLQCANDGKNLVWNDLFIRFYLSILFNVLSFANIHNRYSVFIHFWTQLIIDILIFRLSPESFIRWLLNTETFIMCMLVFGIHLRLLNVDTVAYALWMSQEK